MITKRLVAGSLAVFLATLACGSSNTNSVAQANVSIPRNDTVVSFEGGDGSSLEKAVIIKNATDESAGVGAEATWLTRAHPKWKKQSQSLLSANGRFYDEVTYVVPDGSTMSIWFDITDFYGKTTYTAVSELKKLPHSKEDMEAIADAKDYTVSEDEDVYAIAVKFDVPPTLIREVNNLESIDLQKGQVIKVPAYKKKSKSWWRFW